MSDLASAINLVAGTLEEARIPYMVIGGLANLAWGEPRSTLDVDVTVDVAEYGELRFVELAGAIGRALPGDPAAFAASNRVLPIVTADGTPVDFVLATLGFEFAAIRRAREITIEGGVARVVTPEDLVILKIVSQRPKDLDDVVGVLRRQGAAMDLRALDATVEAITADTGESDIRARFAAAKRLAGL